VDAVEQRDEGSSPAAPEEENPVAWLLGGRVGGSRFLSPAVSLLLPIALAIGLISWTPSLPRSASPMIATAYGPRLLLEFTAMLGVAGILIVAYSTEWHFNRMVARLRRHPLTDELIASALGVDDILSGVEIAAQRRATTDRIAFVAGALIAFLAVVLRTTSELMLLVAVVPVAILLAVYFVGQRERVLRPRHRANSPRVQATTLIVLANRGPISSLLLTMLQPLVFASLLAALLDPWYSLGGLTLFLGILFALGKLLSSEAHSQGDDPFAVAFRRHLYPERRAGRRTEME
jgi:hypothetical protein